MKESANKYSEYKNFQLDLANRQRWNVLRQVGLKVTQNAFSFYRAWYSFEYKNQLTTSKFAFLVKSYVLKASIWIIRARCYAIQITQVVISYAISTPLSIVTWEINLQKNQSNFLVHSYSALCLWKLGATKIVLFTHFWKVAFIKVLWKAQLNFQRINFFRY